MFLYWKKNNNSKTLTCSLGSGTVTCTRPFIGCGTQKGRPNNRTTKSLVVSDVATDLATTGPLSRPDPGMTK